MPAALLYSTEIAFDLIGGVPKLGQFIPTKIVMAMASLMMFVLTMQEAEEYLIEIRAAEIIGLMHRSPHALSFLVVLETKHGVLKKVIITWNKIVMMMALKTLFAMI